jgi:hypothetical protein
LSFQFDEEECLTSPARSKPSRREVLKWTGVGLAAAPFASLSSWAAGRTSSSGSAYEGTDEELLDDIQRAAFRFFWNETDPRSGQIKDRAFLNGNDSRTMSSIAATGFGLTTLCIGDTRGYARSAAIRERVRTTLQFIYNDLECERGFYYHFVDMSTGKRWRKCELSSVDTSLLLCGVLTARQYFRDAEIKDLATKIYNRVDWPWMLNKGYAFAMGWTPENGFLRSRWDHYGEMMMIYLLGIGSPTNPVSPETWKAFSRPKVTYDGITYIAGRDPLFTHQYSHAWFDFRNKEDAYTNYFENSILATRAHKQFCQSLRSKFGHCCDDLWGISASDSPRGYMAWGGPPVLGPVDGSIVPCATGGSVPFLYEDCMQVLRTIRGRYSQKGWGVYGFVDAFNPTTGWYDTDVLGIDVGITMVMIENYRSAFAWNTFMLNTEAQAAMLKAGFQYV